MRRLRASEPLRDLVRETHLQPSQFILPLFVVPGSGVRREIASMPGNFQLSIDEIVREAAETAALGIGGVLLFGIPDHKDETASEAYAEDGIVQRAVRAIKQAVPSLLVMTDVCNCEYTSHGHCGKIVDGQVDNDATLDWLAKASVSHARAGADIVAPSDMMDGRVAAIRRALDAEGLPEHADSLLRGEVRLGILRAVPRRCRIGAAVRRPPQLPNGSGQRREALREIELDLEEGADMIMVKPAMPYLDIIRQARDRWQVPLAAYQVSGEFSMIMAAARNGWIDCQRAMFESLTAIRRAGADITITYFAKQAAALLRES